MTHIGIDPGSDGAIVIINNSGGIQSECFPKVGLEYDIRTMYKRFVEIRALYKDLHVVLEDVTTLQKPFDSGNWKLSASKHIIMTLLIACDIPHTLVSPKTWQKEMWEGVPEQRKPNKTVQTKKGTVVKKGDMMTKEMSKLAALRLFPRFDMRDPNRKTERAQSLHDGVIDALLMAEYSRRKFN